MTYLYSDEDLWNAVRQKRRIWCGFLGATAVFLAGFIIFTVCYIMLPYNDSRGKWLKVGISVLIGLYIIFCFPYLGIKYKRSRAYCKMLTFFSIGLKEFAAAPYLGVEDWTTRDGVDVNVAAFTVKHPKRDEDMTRQIYVDGEKDFPFLELEKGRKVSMILQGNLLLGYEIEDAEKAEEITEKAEKENG